MRISDWSSDVCSSDLVVLPAVVDGQVGANQFGDRCMDGVGRQCRHRQVYPGCACPYTSGNAIRVVVGQVESMAHIETKLPKVGTTIFTVMSQLAAEQIGRAQV